MYGLLSFLDTNLGYRISHLPYSTRQATKLRQNSIAHLRNSIIKLHNLEGPILFKKF